jgi:Tfp pilus assembly protein PilO
MRKAFNFPRLSLPASLRMKEPRVLARIILGALLAANMAAAIWAFKPWGGSPEDLLRDEQDMRRQLVQQQARLARTRTLVSKVEQARKEGGDFLTKYTSNRRVISSTMIAELDRAAREAGIKPREVSIQLEPVEGSDALSQLTITAGFEGTYQSLTKFVNLLDKSPKFLIIESMQASPQQAGAVLNVSLKLDTFVRESSGGSL